MTDATSNTIRSEDVDALAAKLQPFIEGLPDQEQQVLGWILVRAKSASTTSGGELASPVSTSLAQAAGFEEAPGQALRGDEITVAWKHSF